MDRTASFYSRPSYAQGGGFVPFMGSRRQRGGSIFGSLKRMFLPALKTVGRAAVKHGLANVVGLANDVMSDAAQGRSIKDSLVRHGKTRAKQFGTKMASRSLRTLSGMVEKGGQRAVRRPQGGSRPPSTLRKSKQRAPSSLSRLPKKRRRTSNF